eukprot:2721033-Pyramimonas_sp.AAC.1
MGSGRSGEERRRGGGTRRPHHHCRSCCPVCCLKALARPSGGPCGPCGARVGRGKIRRAGPGARSVRAWGRS